MVIRIDKWAVLSADLSTSIPDELCQRRLLGQVYEHPAFFNGREIITSLVDGCFGRYVMTQTGHYYYLLTPHPAFLRMLSELGYTYDEHNPMKLLKTEQTSE